MATHSPWPSSWVFPSGPLLRLGLELQEATSPCRAWAPKGSSTDISPGSMPDVWELLRLSAERSESRRRGRRPLSPLLPALPLPAGCRSSSGEWLT